MHLVPGGGVEGHFNVLRGVFKPSPCGVR